MLLRIKNMVCPRCVMVVDAELKKLGLRSQQTILGEAMLEEDVLTEDVLKRVEATLHQLGFELLYDKRSQTIERIKTFVIQAIHHTAEPVKENFSWLLANHLHRDYSYLSKLFSDAEGITIEQFVIAQKIERVKELLQNNQLSLSEIAWQLGYSSTSHLSTQFKKTTGVTPTAFKAGAQTRQPLTVAGQK